MVQTRHVDVDRFAILRLLLLFLLFFLGALFSEELPQVVLEQLVDDEAQELFSAENSGHSVVIGVVNAAFFLKALLPVSYRSHVLDLAQKDKQRNCSDKFFVSHVVVKALDY